MVTDCSESSKLKRGFEAFERNTGQRHRLYTPSLQARAAGADPLTDLHNNLEWSGQVSVGTPPRVLTGKPSHPFFPTKLD